MKTTKLLPIFLLLIILQACNSQTKNKLEKDMKKLEISKPFDLSNLTLNEDIKDILSSVNLSQKDTIKNEELTLIGNKRLVFDSENILAFNKVKLANSSDLGMNNVIFHYGKIDPEIGAIENEQDNIVGMYQINLYTKFEADKLFNNLNILFGKPNTSFTLSSVNTFLWVNNDICYYYFTRDDDKFYRVLFVYKKTHKEWINFIRHLGFNGGNLN